ncbi:hypothetical protein LDENG_00116920 [Lucifuga dentata]|nr:hypothetical protein LDENG_00116920 [Lucifuga dentata]
MSWLSPTSTRMSLQASLSSTHSLYTLHSTAHAAYEKDRKRSQLKNLPVHCCPVKLTNI